MSSRYWTTFLLMIMLLCCSITGNAAPLPKMRPYTGVGVVQFSGNDADRAAGEWSLPLYEEPGLTRVTVLTTTRLPGNEWIFPERPQAPLIVTARKGSWLRVVYDDAGREGWLDSAQGGIFQTWEQYLKQQSSHLLAGLQQPFYQLAKQPGGKQLSVLTPRQFFKILRLEGSWCQVLAEQSQIGWLRWVDDDGRLLVGFGR